MTNKIWNHRVIIIGISGLSVFLLSYPIAEWLGTETTPIKFFKDIGMALVISTIVALALERMVHESLLNNVDNALDRIKNSSDVLKGAVEMGLEDIFARRSENGRERWEKKVENAIKEQFLKNSGEILIACVASPEFFDENKKIGEILWEGISQPENSCILKVLLLCPKSESAKLRAKLEPEHRLMLHIEAAAIYLNNLKTDSNANNKVQYRCYELPPIAFLVITDTVIFMEAYPMMRVENGKGSIGGRTPMLVARKDTETFRRWKAHFEYIWTEQSNDYVMHHLKK